MLITRRRRKRSKGAHNHAHPRSRTPRLEPLEPRVVLSAVSALASAANDAVGETSNQGGGGSVVNGSLVSPSQWPAVGIVNGQCTGTLISPRHVLTADHCTTSGTGAFSLGGQVYSATEQISHPTADLAILVLSQDVNGVTPRPILREAPIVGEDLTLVGYGAGGTTGNPANDFGNLRVGHTRLEEVRSTLILWLFDGSMWNGSPESNTAPGDSGGPAFVERDGELYIAGVTSGGTGNPWVFDNSFDVRVDAFANWIDDVIGVPTLEFEPDRHFPNPAPGATVMSTDGDNAWGLGNINGRSDRDVFEFTVNERSEVTLTAVATTATLDTQLRLYDSSTTLVAESNDIDVSNTNSQIVETLDPGTYYAMLSSYFNSNTGWFSLAVDLSPNPTGDQHAGFPGAPATDLATDENGEIALRETLEANADRDTFEFIVDQTSVVQFAATAVDSGLNPMLRLYNSSGGLIKAEDDLQTPSKPDSYFFTTLDPGTYYIQVISSGAGSAGDYVLTVDGAIPPPMALPADFDDDGDVDGDDFLVWQASFGVDGAGDADDDGDTDGDDFLIWQSSFGSGSGSAAVTAEPLLPRDLHRESVRTGLAWQSRVDHGSNQSSVSELALDTESRQIRKTDFQTFGHDDQPLRPLARPRELRTKAERREGWEIQRDRTETHDRIFAERDEWMPVRVRGKLR